MQMIRNNLANFFTVGNLICGFFGIIFAMEHQADYAFLSMVFALILDFFDGFIARLTKTSSAIGKDLDSLADAISFGVLPGILAYQILPEKIQYLAAIIPAMSVWRLAKFNNDERSNAFFYGLPTPANALCVAGIYWDYTFDGATLTKQIPNFELIFLGFIVLSSLMLISNIRLLSNKISNFTFKKYSYHIAIIIFGIVAVVYQFILGLSITMLFYILLSIAKNYVLDKNKAA